MTIRRYCSGWRFLPFLFLLWALISPPVLFAADDVLTNARSMLESGKYEQAYTLLEPLISERSGEAEFDYLLGLSALRSGKPAQAMFALERVVQSEPGYAAARMELVSAYLSLGLNRQAQAQLDILQTQSPPEAAREAMSRYQDILRPRLSDTPDPVRLVGVSAGYDSNVGSYPDMGIDLGGLLLTIDPVDSTYALLRGTWWQPVRLSDERRLDFTFHGQIRSYQDDDAEQFSLGLLHGGMLLNTTVDASNKYGLGLQANKLWLDSESFRDHAGVNGFWERRLDAELYGQLGLKAQTFHFENSLNDYDLYELSGELKKRWTPKLRTAMFVGVGYESSDDERPGGDAMRYKLGGLLDYRIDQRNQTSAELSWSHTQYQNEYLAWTLYNLGASDKERTDDTFDLTARWRHLLNRDWQVDTDLTYRKQDSTLRFYEIDRWTAQLTVLRYF